MKNLIFILIAIVSLTSSDVPDKYWIDDNNFEEKISNSSAFGDDNLETIVVEFWAEFNEANCFNDWNKIKNAKYYRVDIAKAPLAKKKYKVRMVPTIIIFKEGSVEESFKAGLDLTLPADLNDIQEAINEINTASAF
jgi:thiol-disulfide isomerase/thioredoxin|tara:strand:- start:72 stop:482 length:411 start_codon:yes stop_codon:yes gene_type:complete